MPMCPPTVRRSIERRPRLAEWLETSRTISSLRNLRLPRAQMICSLRIPTGEGVRSMQSCRTLVQLGTAAVALCSAGGVFAQSRSSDNAVTQAEDAFGFSVGRESLGIYSSGNARGFSPTAAGNVRINGLYFDPGTAFAFQAGLPSPLLGSISIKLGLSAQGYP